METGTYVFELPRAETQEILRQLTNDPEFILSPDPENPKHCVAQSDVRCLDPADIDALMSEYFHGEGECWNLDDGIAFILNEDIPEKQFRTIISYAQDEDDISSFAMHFEVPSADFDLVNAIIAASVEYCQTEEGRKIYLGNAHSFTFEDFSIYVPQEICEKHGFRIVRDNSEKEITIDGRMTLVDESDILSVDGDDA